VLKKYFLGKCLGRLPSIQRGTPTRLSGGWAWHDQLPGGHTAPLDHTRDLEAMHVESPSLEIFKPCLDAVLCSLRWVTLLQQGVGLGDPQRALPTPTFCDSVICCLYYWSAKMRWRLGS